MGWQVGRQVGRQVGSQAGKQIPTVKTNGTTTTTTKTTYFTIPDPPALQSVSDLKTRVMDGTIEDLSLLANFLGYRWCGGCRPQFVGEDFKRNGDSWEADKKGPCDGYNANHRLKLHYGDFKFAIKTSNMAMPLSKA